jgi:hypothetical protein
MPHTCVPSHNHPPLRLYWEMTETRSLTACEFHRKRRSCEPLVIIAAYRGTSRTSDLQRLGPCMEVGLGCRQCPRPLPADAIQQFSNSSVHTYHILFSRVCGGHSIYDNYLARQLYVYMNSGIVSCTYSECPRRWSVESCSMYTFRDHA